MSEKVEKSVVMRKGIIDNFLKSGRFVTVEFIAKGTGQVRKMNCKRIPVTNSENTKRRGSWPWYIMPVWDTSNKSYRSFDVRTVQSISGDGCSLTFNK